MSIISHFKKKVLKTSSLKVINRFKKDEDGATAVEFALVGGPFFLLVFAIIESSLLFFANQALETIVDDVARLYRTGQIANISTKEDLKKEMCRRVVALFDCNKIVTQVDSAAKFSDLPPPPVSNDPANVSSTGSYAPPERFPGKICGNQIIQFSASYEWPIYTNYSAPLVSEGLNNNALINVTAVVRTENFPDSFGVNCP
jgi:hypothetical protein